MLERSWIARTPVVQTEKSLNGQEQVRLALRFQLSASAGPCRCPCIEQTFLSFMPWKTFFHMLWKRHRLSEPSHSPIFFSSKTLSTQTMPLHTLNASQSVDDCSRSGAHSSVQRSDPLSTLAVLSRKPQNIPSRECRHAPHHIEGLQAHTCASCWLVA